MNASLEKSLDSIKQATQRGDLPTALLLAQGLVCAHPDNADAWSMCAHVESMRCEYDAAVAAQTKAIEISPSNMSHYFMRGSYYFYLKDYRSATADFSQVLELGELTGDEFFSAAARLYRADAFVRLGRYEEAKADCAHIPDDESFWTDRLRRRSEILEECPT